MNAYEYPAHELVDFIALAAQLTNEQKILAALLRIELLLTPAPAPTRSATMQAAVDVSVAKEATGKFTGRRK